MSFYHIATQPAASVPRFLIVGVHPRFGGRDEIIGTTSFVEASAFTKGWAAHLAAKIWDEGGYAGGEADLRVVDLRPEPYVAPVSEVVGDDDLPF